MIAKIAVFLAVVAVASAGVASVVSVAHSPASTVKLANVAPVAVTYAAAPQVAVAGHGLTYAAGPIAYSHQQVVAAPVTYAAAPVAQVAIPAPVAYSTGARVVQTYEPVEQHGYQIAY